MIASLVNGYGFELAEQAQVDGLSAQLLTVQASVAELADAASRSSSVLTAIEAALTEAREEMRTFTDRLGAIQNPVTGLAIDALSLVDHLRGTSEAYMRAIEVEAGLRRQSKDAASTLSKLENQLVADLVTMADAGAGPLAGVAKTSKSYPSVLEAAVEKERTGNPTLSAAVKAARKAELAADEARSQMDVAREAYSAAKHAADLMGFILNAVSKG